MRQGWVDRESTLRSDVSGEGVVVWEEIALVLYVGSDGGAAPWWDCLVVSWPRKKKTSFLANHIELQYICLPVLSRRSHCSNLSISIHDKD